YEDKNLSYVSEPDLQLAITRLDMELLTDADIKKYTEELKKMNLKIELPSGEVLKDESGEEILVGDLIAGYLKDPYIEPEFTPGKTPYWRIELNMPKSLKVLPNRLSYSHDAMFTIFPNWGDYSLTAIHRDYEVYHGQGIVLRQIARRRKPVTKGAMMNWIAIQGNLSVENADDIIKASQKAWDRGLLTPGIADISELDWSGGTPSNLASLAASMENMAKEGMLSLVWMAACDVVEVSLKAPRMLAGTAEIVKFIRDYLNEVIFAVENKLATQNVLEMNAIKSLATKSGSSKAVGYAKEIVSILKSLDIVKDTDKSDELAEPQKSPDDFDKVWVVLPKAKKLINDNVEFDINVFEVRKGEKAFRFNLRLPDKADRQYQVTVYGWFYGLSNEGQVSGFEADSNGKIIDEDAKSVWLHYDESKEKIVVSKYRNRRDEKDEPMKGKPTPYSKIFLTIAVSTLAQDGESIYGAKSLFRQLVDSGYLSVENLREIMRELLLHEDISPAKLVRIVEKENKLLSICYVMLIECIKYAGEMVAANKKPPVWVNRVLDICIYYADYLREAAKRGYIPAEDAKWQGLLEIAKSSAKSAAINKAKSLVKVLGIG
ncbi:MAG: PRTRC system protein E, partial [Lachnoanaerobaculum gingivalis]